MTDRQTGLTTDRQTDRIAISITALPERRSVKAVLLFLLSYKANLCRVMKSVVYVV